MTTYRLWPATNGPGSQVSDTENYTLGVEFYVTDSGCTLTQIHFWASGTIASSDHAVRLYQVDGADTGSLVTGSSKALPSPLVAGWNTATLDTPIALTADQRYRAAVWFTTTDGYTVTGHYWDSGAGSAGITNGPLVAPNATDTTGNDQGSFDVNADDHPNDSFNSGNYWIDVTIDDGVSGGTDGALAGTTPAPSGALTGAHIATGALAGTTAAPSAALTGTHTVTGVLAGVTAAPAGALTGTHTVTGALAATTPAPVGALTADNPETTGVLAAVTPAPAAALTATLTDLGVLAGVTGAPSGALAGAVTVAGALAGLTSPPVGSLSDLARVGAMRAAARAAPRMRGGARQLTTMRKG